MFTGLVGTSAVLWPILSAVGSSADDVFSPDSSILADYLWSVVSNLKNICGFLEWESFRGARAVLRSLAKSGYPEKSL